MRTKELTLSFEVLRKFCQTIIYHKLTEQKLQGLYSKEHRLFRKINTEKSLYNQTSTPVRSNKKAVERKENLIPGLSYYNVQNAQFSTKYYNLHRIKTIEPIKMKEELTKLFLKKPKHQTF